MQRWGWGVRSKGSKLAQTGPPDFASRVAGTTDVGRVNSGKS